MIFGLIRRGIQKHWKKDLDNLHGNLSISFENIRNDIEKIHNHVHQQKKHIDHFETRINILENNYDLETTEKEGIHQEQIPQNLTSTQKKLFLAIYEIQNRTSSNISSLKSLSKLLYPNKTPSSIRSTISEYIKVLENQGLISKKRIGKETYVALTGKGAILIKQLNKKRKVKTKIKK